MSPRDKMRAARVFMIVDWLVGFFIFLRVSVVAGFALIAVSIIGFMLAERAFDVRTAASR